MRKRIMKQIITAIVLISTLTMTGCQTDLPLNDIIDQNSPFSLTIWTVDPETGYRTNHIQEIEVNSEKWIKLVDFLKNNMDGLDPTLASTIGDINVSQGDFRLIYTQGWFAVVVSFTDEDGDPKNYIKEIEKGKLDFLNE
jgi:hypothetical protein